MKTNQVLFIEDVKAFAETFRRTCKVEGIIIDHKISFEGLKSVLPTEEHSYAAIVLDIKCLLTDDQAIEDSRFIGTAMTYLNTHCPKLPRFIFTGDESEMNKLISFYSNEKIFLKDQNGFSNLIEELKNAIQISEVRKLMIHYPGLENISLDNLFGKDAEKDLLHLISSVHNGPSSTQYGGICRDIRTFQERILKSINLVRKDVVPDKCYKSSSMLNFNMLMKHLSGYPNKKYEPTKLEFQNGSIGQMNNMIYRVCGQYIHYDKEKYKISIHTIQSCLQALIEIIYWSKNYLK